MKLSILKLVSLFAVSALGFVFAMVAFHIDARHAGAQGPPTVWGCI